MDHRRPLFTSAAIHTSPVQTIRTIPQPEDQHLSHTPIIIQTRRMTMHADHYGQEITNSYQTNTGYQMQPTQDHTTGRNTFDKHSVKNSSKCYSKYDSLVNECSCTFCKCVNFDTQPCTARLHSQPVENIFRHKL